MPTMPWQGVKGSPYPGMLWSGVLESDDARRRADGKGYRVAVFVDGSGFCSCTNFAISAKRVETAGLPGGYYRCKHITRSIFRNDLRDEVGDGYARTLRCGRGDTLVSLCMSVVQDAGTNRHLLLDDRERIINRLVWVRDQRPESKPTAVDIGKITVMATGVQAASLTLAELNRATRAMMEMTRAAEERLVVAALADRRTNRNDSVQIPRLANPTGPDASDRDANNQRRQNGAPRAQNASKRSPKVPEATSAPLVAREPSVGEADGLERYVPRSPRKVKL